jgi:pyruvate/2-oxoglutarate dehydrogenase complex dihydrolipoamide acyltransferase (E2) component
MDIRIPKLGVSMTEGALTSWLVQDGAAVEPGTPLYIIETDKAQTEVEAPAAGTLRIVVAAGDDEHPVGTLIAELVP